MPRIHTPTPPHPSPLSGHKVYKIDSVALVPLSPSLAVSHQQDSPAEKRYRKLFMGVVSEKSEEQRDLRPQLRPPFLSLSAHPSNCPPTALRTSPRTSTSPTPTVSHQHCSTTACLTLRPPPLGQKQRRQRGWARRAAVRPGAVQLASVLLMAATATRVRRGYVPRVSRRPLPPPPRLLEAACSPRPRWTGTRCLCGTAFSHAL